MKHTIYTKITQIFIIFVTFNILSFANPLTTLATDVTANITTDTTWNNAGSPYNLTGNRAITGAGTDLTIDTSGGPVVVTFCNNCYLQVQSGTTLSANGTVTNSVTFKHVSSTTAAAWDTIYVESGSTVTVDYSIFNYSQAGLKCRGGTCNVSHSTFDTNTNGIVISDNSSLTTVINTFNKNTYYPLAIEPESGTINLGSGGNADVLGTGANLNGYNVIGLGTGNVTSSNCTGDVCTIPQRTFAGISNIPYQFDNNTYTVNGANDTLVFDAGVVLKLGNNATFTVNNGAKVDINGTAGNEVILTSSKDDTYGGDSNNDASATSPAIGNYDRFSIGSGANTMDYFKMFYANYGLYITGASTSLTLNDSTYQSNNQGIGVLTGSTLTTARNTFNKNAVTPIVIALDATSYTFGTGGNADILGSGANKNGHNAIGIGYNFVNSSSSACPSDLCTLSQKTFAGISNIPYLVYNDDYSIAGSNDTLAIDAGVIVKFNTSGSELLVSNGAKIDINGTSGNEVIFTSYRDDTYGGDTNNDVSATAPAKGDVGRFTMGTGTNTIDYLKMYYFGYGMLVAGSTTSLTINDSLIENNINGISFYSKATATTARNTFNKNTSWPISIGLDVGTLTFGTGGNVDILGTGGNLNGFNAIGIGLQFIHSGVTDCASDICTMTQRTFAGITNIPYVFESNTYTVSGSNDTLVIDPGVVVKAYSGYAILNVQSGAKLDINGTVGSPVIFTSYKDDNFGGDTNNDSTATSPAAGDWGRMTLSSGANTIDYLKIYYAGSGLNITGASTSLAINDSIYESMISGLGVYGSASLTTARNTFNKNTTPIMIGLDAGTLSFGSGGDTDILGTGSNKNTYNALLVGTPFIHSSTNACPADVCTMSQRNFAGISNIPYLLMNDTYTVNGSNDTLAINAGVIIKGFSASTILVVNNGAKLDVNGNLENPVIFTSSKDDTYGGDTNNDASATSPALNNWLYVTLAGSGAHTIDFAKFKYNARGLSFDGTNITVNDTEFSYNTTGLYFGVTTSPTLARLNVENNGTLSGGEYRWGGYNNTGTSITATNLFWGATLGPNDADAAGSCGLNTTSTGNAVRDTAANPINWCTFSAIRFNSHHTPLQYKADGTTSLATGDINDSSTAVAKMMVDSFTTTGTLTMEVEAKSTASSFNGTATHTGNVSYTGIPVQGTVTLSGLSDANYHWQSRICNASALCSTWISYGANAESATDFQVVTNQAPDVPSSLGAASYVNGSYGADVTPTLSFTLSDPDGSDTVKYAIDIDDTSGFASPVVTYTSALAAQGSASFTVGQAEGSGSYSVGGSGQTLSDGSYYWRVKTIDNSLVESGYTTANGGAVAFIVDSTAPTIPGTPSTSTPTSDNTPSWTWTSSTDGGSGLATNAYSVQWCTDSSYTGCGANTATSITNSYTHSVGLSDNTWYFKVKAIDATGNESAYSSNGTVLIDTANPSVPGTPSTTTPTTDLTPIWSWTASSDSGSGLATNAYSVQWCTDSSYAGCGSNVATSTTNSYTHSVNLYDGIWYFRAKASDVVGNESAYSSNGSVVIDTTNPLINLTPLSPDPTIDQTPTLGGSASDTGSISGVSYQVDSTGGTWLPCAASDGGFDESSEDFSCTTGTLTDGTHTMYVRAIDNAANYSSLASDTFTIDLASPVAFSLIYPTSNRYIYTSRPIFKWQMSADSTSGLSKYVLSVDNSGRGDSEPSGDFVIDNIPVSGTVDYETSKYVLNFDNENNEISIYTKSSSDWSRDSVTGENDGQLREGKVNWNVKAVDGLGNITQSSNSFYYDQNSPTLTFSKLNDLDYSGESIVTSDTTPTLFGKITDSLSGGDTGDQTIDGPKIASGPKLVRVTVNVFDQDVYTTYSLTTIDIDNQLFTCNSAIIGDSTYQLCDKYFAFEFTPSSELPIGIYQLVVYGEDVAGNSTTKSLDFRVSNLSQIITQEQQNIIDEELNGLPLDQATEIIDNLDITKVDDGISNDEAVANQSNSVSPIIAKILGMIDIALEGISTAIKNIDIKEAVPIVADAGVKTGTAVVVVDAVVVSTVGLVTLSSIIMSSLGTIYQLTSRSLLNLPYDYLTSLIQFLTLQSTSLIAMIVPSFGKNKKQKSNGLVFDAYSSKPISGVYVILFSPSGNLKTSFTDSLGRYNFGEIIPDDYQMRSEAKDYVFPSSIITSTSTSDLGHVYQPGELIPVEDGGKTINELALPMDPKTGLSKFTVWRRKIGVKFQSLSAKVKIPTYMLSFIITGVALWTNPSTLNQVVATILTVYTLAKYYLAKKKETLSGMIINSSKEPMSNVLLKLYKLNSTGERGDLYTTTKTDKMGKYLISPEPGNYELTGLTPDGQSIRETVRIMKNNPTVDSTFELVPNRAIPII